MNLPSFDHFADSNRKRFTLKYLHGLVLPSVCVYK